jgi:hypothetical protein
MILSANVLLRVSVSEHQEEKTVIIYEHIWDVWYINILESILTYNMPIILWNMNNWCHIWTKRSLYI